MSVFFTTLCLLLVSFSLQAQTVYLRPTEALKSIFSASTEITQEKKELSIDQKQKLEKKLGTRLARNTWSFYVARSGKKIDGYALIDNEVGKTEPITFLTAISPEGTVKVVEVLVYRESHGSEVHEKRFLKQYDNKSARDPVRTGQDIKHVTGATLSSRAMSLGIKRALLLWEAFYGKP